MTTDAPPRTPLLPAWRREGPDRIRPLTRWVGLIVLPFLAAAVAVLYLLAADTETFFAWTINPPLTAMALGSAYVGGIWYFAQVVVQDRWHRVKYGFPAVVVFATLLGVATLVHWDRFHFGHISFITWATLYLVTPALTLTALLANWREDDGRPERPDAQVPLAARILLAAIGVAALGTGLALFSAPALLIPLWGWELTPLTARVVGAVLTLPGVVNVWLLVDARWSAFRWMLQAQLVSLAAMALALVLSGGALLADRPMAPAFVATIVLSLALYAAVYLWCERLRGAAAVERPARQ
ncbi:hypothetical protein [Naasia sp. SYSU D00948]|uniref:hypothetical protein n=1 Tax=Naasia sp. SYSU D00948 TaxID=2817379 RepID=UPI001B309D4D|nr:hypothetical protein [Naasia sp. SYSU D00948]